MVIGAGPVVNLVIAFVILFVLAFGVGQRGEPVGVGRAARPAASILQPGDG